MNRKVFWSDIGLVPKIEMANFDGTQRTALVNSELDFPTGLAIDVLTDRLYWCDMKENEVEAILTNGSDRRVVLNSRMLREDFSEPYSIDVFEDFLYIVTRKGVIVKWNKFGLGRPLKLFEISVQLAHIRIYHKIRHAHSNGKE